MTPIDRVGTYRGTPREWAVNTSKNGFPQFVCKLLATELYDAENEVWTPWDYDQEITAFLVLFGAKGVCLNHEQVQKALKWDGASFAVLDNTDWSSTTVQFRVEENTYDGKTNFQVNWIDDTDAEPGSSVKKLDAAGLKALDAKYRVATPAAAPASAPKAPSKAPIPASAADPTTAEPTDATDAPASQDSDAASPPTTSAPPATAKKKKGKKAEKKEDTGLADACTKTEAWAKVAELKLDAVDDNQLGEAWVKSFGEVCGEDTDESDATEAQWAAIRDATLDKIPHCPF